MQASKPSLKTSKLYCVVFVDSCLEMRDMINWERVHPDDINNLTSASGVDVSRQYFLTRLKYAIFDIDKTILTEHFIIAAYCLLITG